MARDEHSTGSLPEDVWERLLGGVRWVYAVCRGFSWSRHLDQPEE